jgi:hypothetical protein
LGQLEQLVLPAVVLAQQDHRQKQDQRERLVRLGQLDLLDPQVRRDHKQQLGQVALLALKVLLDNLEQQDQQDHKPQRGPQDQEEI